MADVSPSQAVFEWAQRVHQDGLGYYEGIGTPFQRIKYTNAREDAETSERFLRSDGWQTARVVNEPGFIQIHACRPLERLS